MAGGNLVFPAADQTDAYSDYAGIPTVITFDPFSETWSRQPDMRQGRWYPSQLELADGSQLIVGGYNQRPPGGLYNKDVELFEPGSGSSPGTVSRLRKASRQTYNYPHLFQLPDGRVLLAGPGRDDSATLSRKFEWSGMAKPVQDRIGGTATMLPEGPKGSSTVVQVGGHPAGMVPATATETAEVIDAAAKKPRWRPFAPLNIARSNHNTVLLPDGSMVTVGGGSGVDEASGNYRVEGTERRQVELWDPASGAWRLGPPQAEERTYHSVALLLPDGRVWSAGDDKHPTQVFGDGKVGFSSDDTGEIYSPPYLFGDDGQPLAPRDRPQIVAAPESVRYGKSFSVAAGGSPATQRGPGRAVGDHSRREHDPAGRAAEGEPGRGHDLADRTTQRPGRPTGLVHALHSGRHGHPVNRPLDPRRLACRACRIRSTRSLGRFIRVAPARDWSSGGRRSRPTRRSGSAARSTGAAPYRASATSERGSSSSGSRPRRTVRTGPAASSPAIAPATSSTRLCTAPASRISRRRSAPTMGWSSTTPG